MVRPVATEENKRLGLDFALAATVEVLRDDISEPGPCALVDRSGRHSLFACLQECCPSAIRNDNPFVGRHGMTEIEYSKVLEKNGFLKLRNRSLERAESRACAVEQRVNAPGRESVANINGGQGEGQGIKPLKVRYYYGNRAWLNPDVLQDLARMREAWEKLSSSSIAFAGQCKWELFVAVVRRFYHKQEHAFEREEVAVPFSYHAKLTRVAKQETSSLGPSQRVQDLERENADLQAEVARLRSRVDFLSPASRGNTHASRTRIPSSATSRLHASSLNSEGNAKRMGAEGGARRCRRRTEPARSKPTTEAIDVEEGLAAQLEAGLTAHVTAQVNEPYLQMFEACDAQALPAS